MGVYIVANDKMNHESMARLMTYHPKDLKTVKQRIRVWRIFERIVKCAIITFTVLCFLFIFGYFASWCYVVAAFGNMRGGRNPLPPAKPKLRYARLNCVNDIKQMMRYERFEVCHREPPPRGDTTYFYSYHDIKVTILQEYDYKPYYVFYGRVQLSKPDDLPSPVKDIIPLERETDFFLVNAFNPGAAKSHRGYGSPDHYIWRHVNFGYEQLKK